MSEDAMRLLAEAKAAARARTEKQEKVVNYIKTAEVPVTTETQLQSANPFQALQTAMNNLMTDMSTISTGIPASPPVQAMPKPSLDRVKVCRGYYDEMCSEFTFSDFLDFQIDKDTVYYISVNNDLDKDGDECGEGVYFASLEELETVEIWRCGRNNCFHHDRPPEVDWLYVCANCESVWYTEMEAHECCK